MSDKSKKKAKEPSQRQLRVCMEIRKVLADVFIRQEIPLPTMHSITVTQVKISPDFGLCSVYVLPLSGDKTQESIDFLNSHKGYFRKRMGQKIRLRVTPDIRFIEDDSFDEAYKIEKLLHDPKVQRDIEQIDDSEE